MRLFRYFHDLHDPFRSLTELDLPRPEDYVEHIARLDLKNRRTYDLSYFRRRLATEERLREQFIRMGGNPRRKKPYYLVVENCDNWFYGVKNALGALSIPLEDLDPTAVSFTYGDSVPALDPAFHRGKSWEGRVYTAETITGAIGQFGLPQQWNTLGSRGYETYIEAQVWTDQPIAQYRPAFALQGQEELRRHCALLGRGILDAGAKTENWNPEMEELFSLTDRLRKDRRWRLFSRILEEADPKLFLPGPIHGLPHGQRCALYAFAMGVEADLEEKMLEVLILAGLYHDIGRTGNGEDTTHGARSAGMFPHLFPWLSAGQMETLCSAVRLHCIPGARRDTVGELAASADALDYIRLGIGNYDTSHIPGREGKKLVLCAVEANLLSLRYPRRFMELLAP